MKAIVVEDEYPALNRMKELIEASSHQIEWVKEAMTGREAISLINANKVDVIFLDIQLPDMMGFDILPHLSYNPLIIFTTAYHEYALKAFEYYAIDYLLKPVTQERFDRAIQKLIDLKPSNPLESFGKIEEWMRQQIKQKNQSFPIKKKDRIILIDYDDIVYLKAEDKYVNVVLKTGEKHLITRSLTQLELEFPEGFLRVHRSYIVNRHFVYEIHKHFKGRFVLKLSDRANNSITTGEMYGAKVKGAFGI